MRNSRWLRLLAYVTGSVNQELLLRNEYLAAENSILRSRLSSRLRLSNPALIVRMARENSGWGYDRIVGALANLGHHLSDQTVGNILRRHGLAPAPKRSQITTWKDFLSAHMNVLASCEFFTAEILHWRGLVTHYVLFFIHLESRRVTVAGITRHPEQNWMEQIAGAGPAVATGAVRLASSGTTAFYAATGIPVVRVALGKGALSSSPIHVAFETQGTWLHAKRS